MQVRHLVAAFKAAGHALEVSEAQTDIVLLEDGRTFRRDRLPPEVQAQREAVQPAVRDRGIDEYRYRNDPWYRAHVDLRAAQVRLRPMSRSVQVHGIEGVRAAVGEQIRTSILAAIEAGVEAPAAPQDPRIGLIRQEASNVVVGDVIDLQGPTGGSAYNVRDVEVLGTDRQPLACGVDYRVDAGLGMVMMRTARDWVTIEFRAGLQPQRRVRLGDGNRISELSGRATYDYGYGGAGRVEANFYPREGGPGPGPGGGGPIPTEMHRTVRVVCRKVTLT